MQNLKLFITNRITCWVIAKISQNMVFQTLVTSSFSAAAPDWNWELCRTSIGNSWLTTSTHQALETHRSSAVTLVTLRGAQFLQMTPEVFTKESFPVGVQQPYRLLQMSPPRVYSFKFQIQLQIIKLPANKRRLAKGCGCFMGFLLNEGDSFTAKPSRVRPAAKIPALQI